MSAMSVNYTQTLLNLQTTNQRVCSVCSVSISIYLSCSEILLFSCWN